MITIDLDPSLHLGPLALAWHGIFTAVGIAFGVWLATKLVAPRVSEADATAIATWGVVGGIIGARIFHVADCWTGCTGIPGGYSAHPELIPQIWTGGIAVWGAAIGGALGGLIVALRRGTVPIGFTADAAAPGIALGFAIGRIGDIINGEHHAISCQAPLGICVEYTNPATLGQSPQFPPGDFRYVPDPVHLVVGYDMAWNAAAVAWTLALRGRGLPDGLIFWLWLAWYGLGRFLLGFLRVGDPSYAFGLREDQAIAVLVIAAAIPMIVRYLSPSARRHAKSP
ncbi:MAG TPA: prolipoprotein diacylglyceryl transferase family protein [Candidatus Limnocylindria bacterium]|nr:prolipoprotein diacylglyceryl transferase family protein [Candidatus Limnocylindria bacterium]